MKINFLILISLLFSVSVQAVITSSKCEIKKVAEANHKLNDSMEFYERCDGVSANQSIVGFGVKKDYKNHFYRNAFVQFQDKTLLQFGVAIVDGLRGKPMGMGGEKYLLVHSHLTEEDVLKIYYESIVKALDCIGDGPCFEKTLKSNFFKYFFDNNYVVFRKSVLKEISKGAIAGYVSHISLESPTGLFVTYESNDGKSWQLEFFMDDKQRFILNEVKVLMR